MTLELVGTVATASHLASKGEGMASDGVSRRSKADTRQEQGDMFCALFDVNAGSSVLRTQMRRITTF